MFFGHLNRLAAILRNGDHLYARVDREHQAGAAAGFFGIISDQHAQAVNWVRLGRIVHTYPSSEEMASMVISSAWGVAP